MFPQATKYAYWVIQKEVDKDIKTGGTSLPRKVLVKDGLTFLEKSIVQLLTFILKRPSLYCY